MNFFSFAVTARLGFTLARTFRFCFAGSRSTSMPLTPSSPDADEALARIDVEILFNQSRVRLLLMRLADESLFQGTEKLDGPLRTLAHHFPSKS